MAKGKVYECTLTNKNGIKHTELWKATTKENALKKFKRYYGAKHGFKNHTCKLSKIQY